MGTGKKFKIARIVRGWTQLQLSLITLGRISPSRISLFERDLIDLSDEEIKILTKVLDLSPGLLGNIESTSRLSVAIKGRGSHVASETVETKP
jgi:transcriptional regulator with XRE-family HTH domain